MANIQGSVGLTGFIAPKDSADTYAVFDDSYGRGGFRTVQSISDRDSIPPDRRKIGMQVYVIDTDTTYKLQTDLTNSSWVSVKASVDIIETLATGIVALGNRPFNQSTALKLLVGYAGSFLSNRGSQISLTNNNFNNFWQDYTYVDIVYINDDTNVTVEAKGLVFSTLVDILDYIDTNILAYDSMCVGSIKVHFYLKVDPGIVTSSRAYGLNKLMSAMKGRGQYLARTTYNSPKQGNTTITNALVTAFKSIFASTSLSDTDIVKIFKVPRNPRNIQAARINANMVYSAVNPTGRVLYCYDSSSDTLETISIPSIFTLQDARAVFIAEGVGTTITVGDIGNTMAESVSFCVVNMFTHNSNSNKHVFAIRPISSADTIALDIPDLTRYELHICLSKANSSIHSKIYTFKTQSDFSNSSIVSADLAYNKFFLYVGKLKIRAGSPTRQKTTRSMPDEIRFRLFDKYTRKVSNYYNFKVTNNLRYVATGIKLPQWSVVKI